MSNLVKNMADILERQVCGFHQYILNVPLHLCYVSQNLCEMVGYGKNELLHESKDGYMQLVHPADREKYAAFLGDLSEREQTLTAEYRLLKKDGTVIFVRDQATSEKAEDGTRICSSILTDLTEMQNESNPLQLLQETIPCGFLRYTCEKQPKITYINQTMMKLLRFPAGRADHLEIYKSNIFWMIPMEERVRFSNYLEQVYSADTPIAGEMALLRCDGTRAYIFGWITKTVNTQGIEEFQSVCMDITAQHQARKENETKRYLKALTNVYDKIFAFYPESNMVKCIHCGENSSFKVLENIAMQMDDALHKFIMETIAPEDRERVRAFFWDFCRKKHSESGAKPPQIFYKAKTSTGEIVPYSGIFIKMDTAASLYCCRRMQDAEETDALRSENDQLKENMKALVMRFSDGMAAFEVTMEGMVKPLYASENVCEFFGYTKEEWLSLTEKYTPMDSFVAYSEAAYEDFAALLRNGEAEFTYFDYTTATERRIKAICSQKEPNGNASRYVMLYSIQAAEEEKNPPEHSAVFIRTFGYFDVFVGEKPIAFRNKKSKELFALLVDRKGGYVTSEEAISFLWEEEPVNTVTLSRYRKVALRLKNTLEEYGISDVMESVDGKRRIVMEKVQCDLYQYLSGKEAYQQLFKGSYLTNYSWGEITLGELSGDLE